MVLLRKQKPENIYTNSALKFYKSKMIKFLENPNTDSTERLCRTFIKLGDNNKILKQMRPNQIKKQLKLKNPSQLIGGR